MPAKPKFCKKPVVDAYTAMICSSCACGDLKDNCIKCLAKPAVRPVFGHLCVECGKQKKCVRCRGPLRTDIMPARLCAGCLQHSDMDSGCVFLRESKGLFGYSSGSGGRRSTAAADPPPQVVALSERYRDAAFIAFGAPVSAVTSLKTADLVVGTRSGELYLVPLRVPIPGLSPPMARIGAHEDAIHTVAPCVFGGFFAVSGNTVGLWDHVGKSKLASITRPASVPPTVCAQVCHHSGAMVLLNVDGVVSFVAVGRLRPPDRSGVSDTASDDAPSLSALQDGLCSYSLSIVLQYQVPTRFRSLRLCLSLVFVPHGVLLAMAGAPCMVYADASSALGAQTPVQSGTGDPHWFADSIRNASGYSVPPCVEVTFSPSLAVRPEPLKCMTALVQATAAIMGCSQRRRCNQCLCILPVTACSSREVDSPSGILEELSPIPFGRLEPAGPGRISPVPLAALDQEGVDSTATSAGSSSSPLCDDLAGRMYDVMADGSFPLSSATSDGLGKPFAAAHNPSGVATNTDLWLSHCEHETFLSSQPTVSVATADTTGALFIWAARRVELCRCGDAKTIITSPRPTPQRRAFSTGASAYTQSARRTARSDALQLSRRGLADPWLCVGSYDLKMEPHAMSPCRGGASVVVFHPRRIHILSVPATAQAASLPGHNEEPIVTALTCQWVLSLEAGLDHVPPACSHIMLPESPGGLYETLSKIVAHALQSASGGQPAMLFPWSCPRNPDTTCMPAPPDTLKAVLSAARRVAIESAQFNPHPDAVLCMLHVDGYVRFWVVAHTPDVAPPVAIGGESTPSRRTVTTGARLSTSRLSAPLPAEPSPVRTLMSPAAGSELSASPSPQPQQLLWHSGANAPAVEIPLFTHPAFRDALERYVMAMDRVTFSSAAVTSKPSASWQTSASITRATGALGTIALHLEGDHLAVLYDDIYSNILRRFDLMTAMWTP